MTSTFGQNKKVNNTTQFWSEADFTVRVNKKWRWESDFQYSRQSPYEKFAFLKYGEQLTIRTGAHYYPKSTIKLSAFMGLWYNFPIAGNVGQREYPEYRTTLQTQFNKRRRANTLSYIVKTEIREIKDKSGHFETVLRGRYMFKYQRLFIHKTYDKNSWYCILSDEFFVNGGSAVTGYKLFDQNQFFIGVGYNVTDNVAVETGYGNQFAYHAHDTNFDSNHALQVSLVIDNL